MVEDRPQRFKMDGKGNERASPIYPIDYMSFKLEAGDLIRSCRKGRKAPLRQQYADAQGTKAASK